MCPSSRISGHQTSTHSPPRCSIDIVGITRVPEKQRGRQNLTSYPALSVALRSHRADARNRLGELPVHRMKARVKLAVSA